MVNISRAELPFLLLPFLFLQGLRPYAGLISTGCKENADLVTLCTIILVICAMLDKLLIHTYSPFPHFQTKILTSTLYVWRIRFKIEGLILDII